MEFARLVKHSMVTCHHNLQSMRPLFLLSTIIALVSAFSTSGAEFGIRQRVPSRAETLEPCSGFAGDRSVILLRGVEGSEEEVREVNNLMFNLGIGQPPRVRPGLGTDEAGLPVLQSRARERRSARRADSRALLANLDEDDLMEAGMARMHRMEQLHPDGKFRAGGASHERASHEMVESKDIGTIIKRMEFFHDPKQSGGCEFSRSNTFRRLRGRCTNTHLQWLRYLAGQSAKNRVAIAAQGGIEAVLRAMEAHGSREEVLENGCWTLCKLAMHAGNELAIVAKGGIEAVVGAMRTHASSEAVQTAGCRVLHRLAFHSENKVAIAAKGGIESAVGAMRAHRSSVSMQANGCSLLHNLAVHQENEVAIAAKGGIEAVVGAMEARGSPLVVQEAGCGALSRLAFNAENRVTIAAKGGIDAVVWAMYSHWLTGGVQVKGCLALKNLAMNAENRVAIRAEGGIEGVVRAMWAHGSNVAVQELACSALDNIAGSDLGLQSYVRAAGAIPLIEKALSAFPGKGDLQMHGKNLLEKLGTCEKLSSWGEGSYPPPLHRR